jgi:hypothetical protein
LRPLSENDWRSIRDNFERESNEIETSDEHQKKPPSQITSTEAGRRIEGS